MRINWVKLAKILVKLVVAAPALVELGRGGAAAGRVILAATKKQSSDDRQASKN